MQHALPGAQSAWKRAGLGGVAVLIAVLATLGALKASRSTTSSEPHSPGSAPAAHAIDAAPIPWQRFEGDGIAFDVPPGWTVDGSLASPGNIVFITNATPLAADPRLQPGEALISIMAEGPTSADGAPPPTRLCANQDPDEGLSVAVQSAPGGPGYRVEGCFRGPASLSANEANFQRIADSIRPGRELTHTQ